MNLKVLLPFQVFAEKSDGSSIVAETREGHLPDVETFIRLCNWLGISTDTFITGEKIEAADISEKEKIVFQLRSSRELDTDTINAMVHMVDMAFTKSKRDAQ